MRTTRLLPTGTLEDGAGAWSLPAAPACGTATSPSTSFHVHGAGESRSLGLPPGSRDDRHDVRSGEKTPVAFRFTSQGNATWAIDDVYVDPYRRS